MVRIAPVRLAYNPKALWFDARDLSLSPDDAVVVLTARGLEFGHVDDDVFEGSQAQISGLKSPLKPVKRLATDEDKARAAELEQRSREALPVFRQLAAEKAPDMNPVSVEFLFDGDKAVFYFESDERIDFRDLVRDLAARFRIRVDMKQIGVRDEARMVGGIGHCGQELCCRRLGGEFNPVSIRMAKEQGLSLNPQKISGLCGRLMCCLRYEYDAYKDFHARAPKKNAKIKTPEGEGKVVDMDVPRENISIAIEGEKPVIVPLADMDTEGDSPRPNAVGQEAWERAHASKEEDRLAASTLLTSQLTEKDTLADPTEVRQVGGSRKAKKQGSAGRSSRQRGKQHESEPAPVQHKQRRRRSTKVGADGTTSTIEDARASHASHAAGEPRDAQEGSNRRARQSAEGSSSANRPRRRRSSSGSKPQQPQQAQQRKQAGAGDAQRQSLGSAAPGRKSSALRAHEGASSSERAAQSGASGNSQKRGSGKPRSQQGGASAAQGAGKQTQGDKQAQGGASSSRRRPRRRTHRSGAGQSGAQGGQQQGSSAVPGPKQGHSGDAGASSPRA